MPTRSNTEVFETWKGLVLLDTCAWIWLVDGHQKIAKSSCIAALESAAMQGRLYLSPISMWEVATKSSKGRLTLSLPVGEWITQGKRRARLIDAPFSTEISVESASLPGEFHSDPADRIIVATARVLEAVLVTSDEKMINYAASGFVKIWPL